MGVLTRDMQRVVRERPVGFVATVSADGAPEVAPKSTVTVWDDDHLVFMEDMFSHRTVANLLRNPAVEVVVVDEVTYRAYRFTGRATILTDGPVFGRVMSFFRDRYGSQAALPRVKRIGLIKVQRAAPLRPIYDTGASRDDAADRYIEYHGLVRRRVPGEAAPWIAWHNNSGDGVVIGRGTVTPL